jgi:hypothetical protein
VSRTDGEDDVDVRETRDEPADGGADPLERRAEALAAVGRHDDDPPACRRGFELGDPRRGQCVGSVQRVDHRVAGDDDRALVDALGEEVESGSAGRREMEVGGDGREAPVQLLGERLTRIVRAQARLDVRDSGSAVERGDRSHRRGRRVSLDEHPVGPLAREHRLQPAHHIGRDRSR